ncbi:hypothetical protein NFI96_027545, partial [Prochilodus magdalenae]
ISVSLVCFSTCEVFQASAALQCYQCSGSTCDAKAVTCNAAQDSCQTSTGDINGQKFTAKGCITKALCVETKAKCCQTDLCNGAEGVKLSLLIMLVPLVSSILFL